jgi:hypothetical protein
VPLTAGRQRIALTLRAECTFSAPGAAIADLRYVPTGLDDAALRASPGVEVEELASGRLSRGIPAGGYLVLLAGEETWRGPFDVTSGAPCQVLVPHD